MANYNIEEFVVTGTQVSPQSVLYADLTDKFSEDSLPTIFSSIPIVGVVGHFQIKRASVINESVTGFDIFKAGVGKRIGTVKVNLKISGTAA